jgi:hypothetical protein
MEANMRVMGVLMGKVKEIPTVDATLTKSGFAADAKVVGDKLNEIGTDRLGAEDVVNDLESDAIDKPLSAAMGKALSEMARSGGGFADNVIYDNSESGLDANDVQRAITLLTSMARNALPLEGGTLTGENLYMDSGNVRIQGNENALWMQALNGIMDNDNRRLISLYNSRFEPNAKNALMFEDIISGKKRSYAIYGEHNMKAGKYKNVSASAKYYNVQTDSAGNVAMVFGRDTSVGNVVAFVCSAGAIIFKNGTIEIPDSLKISYLSGSLYIGIPYLMESEKTYYYYIL